MKKLFNIGFSIETLDFFALTPFIAIGNGIGLAWLKWAFVIKIGK